MSDDLERRIETLEGDVETLTEALRTALEWKIGSTSNAWTAQQGLDVRLNGQDATREVLDRLP